MKTKYALKALTYLARAELGRPVLIAEIAEREGIPRKFLELILRELRHSGLLHSRKGRGGGYSLSESPDSISVASVIEALDGSLAPVPCLSRTAYRRCEGCHDERSCGVRLVMAELYAATIGVLAATTIADVVRRVDRASDTRLRSSTKLSPMNPSR
jgi:Rrf2 family protein